MHLATGTVQHAQRSILCLFSTFISILGNPQIFTLREEVRSARQAAHPNEEDAFADVETPKDLSLLQKLCMVCMETERGGRGGGTSAFAQLE